MATTLVRLESPDSDRTVGGVLVRFSETCGKTLSWRSERPITPALDAAKHYVSELMGTLTRIDDAESRAALLDTNWVSVTAAVMDVIRDFNTHLVADLRARESR